MNRGKNYRNFNFNQEGIRKHYLDLRKNQTVSFVQNMKITYCPVPEKDNRKMSIWKVLELLNNLVDNSDPDIHLPNSYHAYQTAEGLRKAGEPDWLQLIGLLHDIGKILFVKGCDKDGTSIKHQFAVVGDTYPVGCVMSNDLVFPDLNQHNSDMQDARYNTRLGIYEEGCGFDNCLFSFGHDEYLYQVLKYNQQYNPECNLTLPEEALYVIRFHSFYPWHNKQAYEYLASQKDKNNRELLQKFSSYDLYTKSDEDNSFDLKMLREYYQVLIKKYIGTDELYW